jgi:putative methionine-R-sulfoxide reductase with GAF domain
MGLYAVTAREIAVIGWSGSGSPATRFPVTQGLSGVAVAGRHAVVVNGASADADRRALEGCAPRSRACLATAHRVGELGM